MHVITCLDVGGAELALRKLALSSQGAPARHVVVSLRDIGVIGRELQSLGITVYALHMNRLVLIPFAFLRLIVLIARLKPDVIQTWMYHGDLLGGVAARLVGRREVIWGVHNVGFAREASEVTLMIVKLCALVSSRVPRVIVCCAEAARLAHAARGYDVGRMRVIPNGFELPHLALLQQQRNTLRDELSLTADALVVGLVARFDPLKNHHGFVQAAKIVAAEHAGVRFLLVGKGADRSNERLCEWIRDARLEDRFILLGQRRDVDACLAAMDVFCLSSSHEAFPNVVGEAMAAAVPCVVTDVGDTALMVADTGWIVPPRDSVQLGRALSLVLSMPESERRSAGLAGRRRIERHFSMARTRELFEQAYIDACAEVGGA